MTRHWKPAALALTGIFTFLLAGCSNQPAANDTNTGATAGNDASTAATTGASSDSDAGTGAEQLEATTITLYTSEPQDKADEIVAAFNKEQPNVKVEVFRAGTGDLKARIDAENKAGGVKADVLLAADAGTFDNYAKQNMLVKYTPTGADQLKQDVIDPNGYYTGTRIIPTVIAYNTTMVQTPPKSWAELADPQYADKIVMPNPDVSGAAAYNAAVWLNEPSLGEDWLTKLAANKPVIADSNGPVSQAVANGTQPIGIVVDYLVRGLADQGSPIAVSYPSEGVPYVSEPAGIFASSKNQDAAKAFVDFLVSKPGQELAVQQSYLPVRDDVGTPEGAPALSEITTITPKLETIQSTQDTAVELFRKLFL